MVGQVLSCCDNKPMKTISSLDKLLKRIITLPNWVKQYFYIALREDLSNYYDLSKLDTKSTKELVQMYVPTPSASGRRVLQRRFNSQVVNFSLTNNQVCFLKSLGLHKKLIDICTDNNWSLIKCAQVFIELIEKGYVESIDNYNVANTVYYIAGRIRLGEYLLRMNKLSLEQVDKALYTQKELNEKMGTKPKIGELLVNLGYINEEDKNDILKFKDQSHVSVSIIDETIKLKEKLVQYNMKFENLKFENQSIKDDLVFYQDELISKANYITELEKKLKKNNTKAFSIKNFFGLKILQYNS